jgi:uncharacterized protein YkwD
MPTTKSNLVTVLIVGAALALLAAISPAGADAFCNFQNRHPKELKAKQARASVKCLINNERDKRGKRDYSSDRRLVKAAERHSRTMAEKSCFSHQCRGERDLLGRLQSVGYITSGLSRWAYAENIAHGTDRRGSPGQIVRSWMNSSPHRAAILSGSYRELGVGYERRGSKGYYTVDFGLRRG